MFQYNMKIFGTQNIYFRPLDPHFSNSLMIHKENTLFNDVFGNQMKNYSFLHTQFLLLKSFCLRSNIKHSTQCFITRWNTSKFVKNTPLRVVFSTLFSVFHLVMKHCISCLIYYINWRIQLSFTLKMTSAQVVETSITVNSNPIQDYTHPDDHISPPYEMTPGFKPVTDI